MMTREQKASTPSAIPILYYIIFAVYEPFLTVTGFIGALADPKKTHDGQAPWPSDLPPPSHLPRASLVSIIQLGHVCALLGIINVFVLTAVRTHLASRPDIQEKIVRALLTPLVLGDLTHLGVTLWALGENRWQFEKWGSLLWSTMLLGISLFVPRMTWHLGIGRYKHSRDGPRIKSP